MAHYRLYLIDGKGHFQRCIDLDAAGDMEAIARAQRLQKDQVMELWRRDRLVRRFEAASSPVAVETRANP